jgi:hypothetical protein
MLTSRLRVALLLPALLPAACTDDGATTEGQGSTSVAASTGDSTGAVTTGQGSTSTPTTGTPTSTDGGTSTTGVTTTGPVTATDSSGPGSTTDVGTSTSTTDASGTTTDASTGSTTTDASSSSTGEPPCPDGTVLCDNGSSKVCDGKGGFKDVQVCANVCLDGVGCKLCNPNSTSCEGDKVLLCDNTGDSQMPVETCDGVQGVVCDPNVGKCAGACAPELLALSYIGCDYYPTVTLQYDLYNTSPKDNFAVAVANTSALEVKITVTRGANMVTQTTVGANTVKIVQLPWVNELTKNNGPSVLVKTGAYRLRTDGPVTVYQYNPLAATTTNDASLLLPVNTWTGNYAVASWAQWSGIPGFYAVTASQDNTKVTLTPSATGKLVQAGGGVAANGTGVVMLNSGDVLEVITQTNGNADLTGTLVNADKPVQVIGGHKCTNVPANISACDHLEESMFPIETLAKEYLVVPTVQVPMDTKDKAQFVRVIATEANTTLVFNPDQPVNKVLANAGDFVELATSTAKFLVTGDKKILVSQYMIGQSGGYGTSDPSMLLAVNPQQWRKSYLIHAPTSWSANYIDFMAKAGANVTLDGVAVGGWQPIGNTGYSVTHAKLNNAGDGNHTIVGDVGVGIAVSGVLNAGSYWYPGGLDLDVIPQ